MTVTGTTLNPIERSASYAAGSSSMFRSVNACPARERNSFTVSQARQCEPVNTVMWCAILRFYAD
jgi:hypothetical protein